MEDLSYTDVQPDIVRVKVENLRVGFVHVYKVENGQFELGRIHEIGTAKNGTVTFRYGFDGHAMGSQHVGLYVDVLRESIS